MSTTRTRKVRPRLRGKLSKPEPLSITDLQRTMHKQSQEQRVVPPTRGAFGGISKRERAIRDADKNRAREAAKDVLPADSPIA